MRFYKVEAYWETESPFDYDSRRVFREYQNNIAKTHYKEIPEINAYYFWNPVKGGISVIINDACEKLGAISTVNYEKLLEAFKSGKRN